MKVRRPFLYLALVGIALFLLDALQRWVYVAYAPVQPESRISGEDGPRTTVVMVAGQGLDDIETATSLRDLESAYQSLLQLNRGRLEVTAITPGRPSYSNEGVVEAVQSARCDRLIVYLTGHGGGRNFGAVGGLNLQRDVLAQALTQASYEEATVVVDCCWSGEFSRSFEGKGFPGKVTLITSTDAKHPSPFPVSFLSPDSFGRTLFEKWEKGSATAFEETNRERARLRWIYGPEFGLVGTLGEFRADSLPELGQ